jgi:hypothetical protein
MTVDLRKLLKDTIRGTMWEIDIPCAPGAVDENGDQIESSREELELFFDIVAEVLAEWGETRPTVIAEIGALEREYLGAEP